MGDFELLTLSPEFADSEGEFSLGSGGELVLGCVADVEGGFEGFVAVETGGVIDGFLANELFPRSAFSHPSHRLFQHTLLAQVGGSGV